MWGEKPKVTFQYGQSLHALCVQVIGAVLEYHQNDKDKAAEALGICVRTVRNYVRDNRELSRFYIYKGRTSKRGNKSKGHL